MRLCTKLHAEIQEIAENAMEVRFEKCEKFSINQVCKFYLFRIKPPLGIIYEFRHSAWNNGMI